MSWKASVSDEAAKTTISPETGAAAGLAALGAAGAGADVFGVVHAGRKTKRHTSGMHRGLEIASTREYSVGRGLGLPQCIPYKGSMASYLIRRRAARDGHGQGPEVRPARRPGGRRQRNKHSSSRAPGARLPNWSSSRA